jgi:hypothetical protein
VTEEPTDIDDARSMRDPCVRERRRGMLHLPHITDLTDYVANLRKRIPGEVPDFDPLDGGIHARVLFLFEKPGPMAAGSGFISRNNDDGTAGATFDFMQQAGIPRKWTVIWNLVPWWNGTRKMTARELREGTACVEELISMLPALCAVVMVGRKAEKKAESFLKTTGLELFTSWHPSPMVRAIYPYRWNAIPSQWAKALPFITKPCPNAAAPSPLHRLAAP